MGQINKTTLQSNYQNAGQIYDDTKTEACFELIADAHNATDSALSAGLGTGAIQTGQLANGSVTQPKIANSAVGANQLDPTLLTNFGDIAVQAEFDRRAINVMKYGVKGDGVTEDTSGIQAAINAAAGKTCYFPPGTYLTDLLTIPSNITILLHKNAYLKAKPLAFLIMDISSKSNISIIGDNSLITMVKEGYTSEYNHAVRIYNSSDILIKGVNISGTGGDCITLGGPSTGQSCKNILIENCVLDNPRRNGISVVFADGITLRRCIFKNASGTAPQFGVDIEPNPDTYVKNVLVEDCVSYGNVKSGFGVYAQAEDVSFVNCRSFNNGDAGFSIDGTVDRIPKNISVVSGCISYGNSVGIYVARGESILVKDCAARNCLGTGITILNASKSEVVRNKSNNNGKYGIVANNSTDVNIDSNNVSDNFDGGILCLTSLIRPIVRNNDSRNNGANASAIYKSNIQVSSSDEPVVVNNIVRMTITTAVSVTGIYITSTALNGYIKENDCFKGGTGAGLYIETAGGSVNAGNRNKNGTYSTSAN